MSHRILRALIVLAIVACAVVIVAPSASAARSTTPSTIQPYYVECSSTIWANTNQTAISGQSAIVTLHIRLQILEDAHDFAFCGGLRTYEYWDQTSGHCDTFYASVRDPSNNNHGTTSAYSCAQGGSIYSYAYYASCGSAHGWDVNTGSSAQTIGGCY